MPTLCAISRSDSAASPSALATCQATSKISALVASWRSARRSRVGCSNIIRVIEERSVYVKRSFVAGGLWTSDPGEKRKGRGDDRERREYTTGDEDVVTQVGRLKRLGELRAQEQCGRGGSGAHRDEDAQQQRDSRLQR